MFFCRFRKKTAFYYPGKIDSLLGFSGPQLSGNEKSTIYLFVDFIKFFVGSEKNRRFIIRVNYYPV